MPSSKRLFLPGPDMDRMIETRARQISAEALSKLNTALQQVRTLEQKLSSRNAKLKEKAAEATKLRKEVARLTKEVSTLRYVAEQKGRKAPAAVTPAVPRRPAKCRECGGPHYTAYCEDVA